MPSKEYQQEIASRASGPWIVCTCCSGSGCYDGSANWGNAGHVFLCKDCGGTGLLFRPAPALMTNINKDAPVPRAYVYPFNELNGEG